MNALGKLIKEKREEKDFSIRKLAEIAEISHTEIKRIEDGLRKQPSPQVLRSIAAALDVPYEKLMQTAGYIDETHDIEESTSLAGVQGADDLTDEELAQVNSYIAFLKSQRK